MPVVPVLAAVSLVASAAGTAVAVAGANKAGNNAQQIAAYNARVDQAEADQIDSNTQANIQDLRRDAAVYMSRQTSSLVRAGVLADTGSALAVRAATAGRTELQVQRQWAKANAEEENLASQGQAGIAEGAAQADMYHDKAMADVLSGVGHIAGAVAGDIRGGAFSGSSSTGKLDSGLTGSTADIAGYG